MRRVHHTHDHPLAGFRRDPYSGAFIATTPSDTAVHQELETLKVQMEEMKTLIANLVEVNKQKDK